MSGRVVFDQIPDDVLKQILHYSGMKKWSQLRLVSKQFLKNINDIAKYSKILLDAIQKLPADEAMRFIKEIRELEAFKKLAKMNQSEMTDLQIISYAFITDNIYSIDPFRLEQAISAQQDCLNARLIGSLKITLLAIQCRNGKHEKLKEALNQFNADNQFDENFHINKIIFVNMGSFEAAGDMSDCLVYGVNLEKAILKFTQWSKSILVSVNFELANVEHAKFYPDCIFLNTNIKKIIMNDFTFFPFFYFKREIIVNAEAVIASFDAVKNQLETHIYRGCIYEQIVSDMIRILKNRESIQGYYAILNSISDDKLFECVKAVYNHPIAWTSLFSPNQKSFNPKSESDLQRQLSELIPEEKRPLLKLKS